MLKIPVKEIEGGIAHWAQSVSAEVAGAVGRVVMTGKHWVLYMIGEEVPDEHHPEKMLELNADKPAG
jgi:hypothetical protein